jgi:hypothetical protein
VFGNGFDCTDHGTRRRPKSLKMHFCIQSARAGDRRSSLFARDRWCAPAFVYRSKSPLLQRKKPFPNLIASRGPFRFFWTTAREAGHAIRVGNFSLRGNDGEEK